MHTALSKLSKKLKNDIEILVGPAVKEWIKTVIVMFSSLTQAPLDLLIKL